ncbi:Uncharacterised protein [Clostridium putrefaciens]|uniref:Uncharacterized protein n=1 Tax=Clostridium putrefaciens TaxID=99675 RepID=A0A381J4B9_9CLOT|nr:Uncharacterised protein [Clostridium putrefaciens]
MKKNKTIFGVVIISIVITILITIISFRNKNSYNEKSINLYTFIYY